MSAPYLICGIDPGTEFAGVAFLTHDLETNKTVWLDYHALTAKSDTVPGRIREIHDQFVGILGDRRPFITVIEGAFVHPGTRNIKTTLQLVKAIGCLTMAAARSSVRLYEGKPSSLRKKFGWTQANYDGLRYRLQEMYPELFDALEDPKKVTEDVVSAMVQAEVGRRLLLDLNTDVVGIEMVHPVKTVKTKAKAKASKVATPKPDVTFTPLKLRL